jgi:hypothetical protein
MANGTVLVVGQNQWHKAPTREAALRGWTGRGGDKRKPHAVYTFGPENTDITVNDITGQITGKGPDPVNVELFNQPGIDL